MTDIDAPLKAALDEVEAIVLDRHRKYSARNITDSPGGPLNGLRVRLFDKLARLNNYVENGGQADFADDKLRDCFVDVVGYGLIGLLVLSGDWPGVDAAVDVAAAIEAAVAAAPTPEELVKSGVLTLAKWPHYPYTPLPVAYPAPDNIVDYGNLDNVVLSDT